MSESAQVAARPSGTPAGRGNPVSRLVRYLSQIIPRVVRFIRQVVAELRKVIWPTRKELLTYTTVVIVFVAIMGLIVAAYDFAFTQGVLAVFGK